MAGYSGTPLFKKLGIKPGAELALLGAPKGFDELLDPMPEGVRLSRRLHPGLDVVVIFTTRQAPLVARFPQAAKALQAAGGLWVAWPKRTSGVSTDLTENVVRDIGLAAGLVDTKVCAIDDVWSGLRFVWRLSDRETRPAPRLR